MEVPWNTEMWARGVLTSLTYSKRRGTTGKVEPSEQFLREEKSTFQRNIASAVQMHDIPEDLVLVIKAGITEAYRNAQEIVTRIENPFHSGEYINE